MRSPSRAALTMVVCLGAALSLSISPVAHAQDDTPAPPPSAFCAVLSADEVSAALGITVTIDSSSDTDCTYADYVSTFTTFNVNFDPNTDFATIVPIMIADADGTDFQVGGRNGRVRNDGSQLYLDTPHGLLGMLMFGQLAEGLNPAAVMQALAATVLSRLDAIPLPTPEPVVTPGPAPSYVGDPELVAMFPTTIGSEPLARVTSLNGPELAAISSDSESLAAIEAGLAAFGKTIDDLSFATGGNASGSILALRIKGVDAASVLPALLPLLLSNISSPVQTPVSLGGKNVIKVTDGPDSPDATATYVYPHNDVIWVVSAQEPGLSEIFQGLP